jgi:hypothetical protein
VIFGAAHAPRTRSKKRDFSLILDLPCPNYAFVFFETGCEALKVNILGIKFGTQIKETNIGLRIFLGPGKFLVASKMRFQRKNFVTGF